MRVTANGGMEMPSWFDILSFNFKREEEDEEGMNKTVYSLNKLIESELDELAPSVPANRIVLGGFSQGGAMSLLTGLTSERKLAGVVCLSGWVPLRGKFKSASLLRTLTKFILNADALDVCAENDGSRPQITYLLGSWQCRPDSTLPACTSIEGAAH